MCYYIKAAKCTFQLLNTPRYFTNYDIFYWNKLSFHLFLHLGYYLGVYSFARPHSWINISSLQIGLCGSIPIHLFPHLRQSCWNLLQEPERTEILPEIRLCHRAGLHNPCAIEEFQVLWIREQWNIRISGTLETMLDGSKWQMWSFACHHWLSSSGVFIHLRTVWNLWCLSKHL